MWLRFRVELGIILVPWLALVVVSSVVALLFKGSELAPLADGLASGAVVIALVVLSPLLLRTVWATSPLPPGPLRERLETFCRLRGFRCQDILVWHTHRHLANAGVVGPTPFLRYVMLTDALLQNCTEEEVEAVFAHEVGHVRHRHLLLYLLFGAAFICFYANLMDLLAAAGLVEPLGDLLALNITGGQTVVMVAFAAVYWGLIFGFISRRMEQQADLFALASTGEPTAFLTALEKLAAMSPSGAERRSISSWRHFSIARRVGFLEAVLAEPSEGLRFRRKVAAIQAALAVALALGVARLLIFRPELFGL
jgi:Zn-dependent protease with chaperone function